MLSYEELLALVAELQRQVAELRASNEALRAEIEQLTRGGKRQASVQGASVQARVCL
jgi:cell division protein FtsB